MYYISKIKIINLTFTIYCFQRFLLSISEYHNFDDCKRCALFDEAQSGYEIAGRNLSHGDQERNVHRLELSLGSKSNTTKFYVFLHFFFQLVTGRSWPSEYLRLTNILSIWHLYRFRPCSIF